MALGIFYAILSGLSWIAYGAVFLHERLSPAQIFGTLFALAGIVLVSL